jgi:hypothetical protein
LVRYCERDIWRALRNLDKSEVEEKVGPYLEKSELRTLLKRREALIEHIQNLVEKHGEKDVLFDL